MKMTAQSTYTLINPATKALAFELFDFVDDSYFKKTADRNYYTIILATKAQGQLSADFSTYPIQSNTMMCFSVYQPFIIRAEPFEGVLIHFHPDSFASTNTRKK